MDQTVPAPLLEWAKCVGFEGLEWRALPRQEMNVYKIAGEDAFRSSGVTLKRVPVAEETPLYVGRYEDALTYPVLYWFSPSK